MVVHSDNLTCVLQAGIYMTGRTREKQASATGELPPTLIGELLKAVNNKKK
jgi:hypothetical protein